MLDHAGGRDLADGSRQFGSFVPASVKYRFPSVPTMIPPEMSPTRCAGRLGRELGDDPAGCDPGDMLVVALGDPEVAVGAAHDPLGLFAESFGLYVVTCPEVVIRPIRPSYPSVNQSAPSDPTVI